MNATVKRSVWGGWVGACLECGENIAGASMPVNLWAEVHNDENHHSGQE